MKGELFGYPPLGRNSRLMVALDGLERAVDRLERKRFAVMLIGFAGDPYRKNEAVWYESGLTSDRSATVRAAARVRSREPAGWSCHACAVFEGARALRRFGGQHRCPLLVLLTDSDPNLPATPWDSSDFSAMNLDAIANTLRSVSPLSALFVVIDDGNPERAAKFERSIGEAGSRAVLADDASQVADAIVGFAGTCRG